MNRAGEQGDAMPINLIAKVLTEKKPEVVPRKRQKGMQEIRIFMIPKLKEESDLHNNHLRFIELIDEGKLPLANTKARLDAN
jgi:phosphopantetheine adenylyltransferase